MEIESERGGHRYHAPGGPHLLPTPSLLKLVSSGTSSSPCGLSPGGRPQQGTCGRGEAPQAVSSCQATTGGKGRRRYRREHALTKMAGWGGEQQGYLRAERSLVCTDRTLVGTKGTMRSAGCRLRTRHRPASLLTVQPNASATKGAGSPQPTPEDPASPLTSPPSHLCKSPSPPRPPPPLALVGCREPLAAARRRAADPTRPAPWPRRCVMVRQTGRRRSKRRQSLTKMVTWGGEGSSALAKRWAVALCERFDEGAVCCLVVCTQWNTFYSLCTRRRVQPSGTPVVSHLPTSSSL